MQFVRARYYDPTTARFITRDPAVSTTRDAYAYAGSNPLNATDPSGLFSIPGTNWCVAIADPSCDNNSGTQNWAGNVLAGAGNALTLGQGVGLTAKIMGKGDNFTACYGNSDSWAYRGGAIGAVVLGAVVLGGGARSTANPLEGVQYSAKVRAQMGGAAGEFHSFPTHVEAFATRSHASVSRGLDGSRYTHVRIPGSYGSGGEGVFHFIVDRAGTMTHRLFEPF
jgi:hypothetical protein